jgi:N-methylhydantoinase A
MKSIIVGQGCGVLSSKGLLIADLKSGFSRSMLLRPPYNGLSALSDVFTELQSRADTWLASEGIRPEGRQIGRFVSLRYENQGHELDVSWDGEDISAAALQSVFEAFHSDHQRLYSFYQKDAPIELTGLRVSALGRLEKPLPYTHSVTSTVHDAKVGAQKVYFEGAWLDCALYNRDLLPVGAIIIGPAIVEQMDATALVLPGHVCRVDDAGNMVVTEK